MGAVGIVAAFGALGLAVLHDAAFETKGGPEIIIFPETSETPYAAWRALKLCHKERSMPLNQQTRKDYLVPGEKTEYRSAKSISQDAASHPPSLRPIYRGYMGVSLN